jgi:hypothetical protein
MCRNGPEFHSRYFGMPVIDLPITSQGPIIPICIHISAQRFVLLQSINQQPPRSFFGRGLIDTGASCTAIDSSIVAALGLTPTGATPIHTPSTGNAPHYCNQYDVSVWFLGQPPPPATPQPAQIHPVHITLPVIEADFSAQSIDALIGRDVLAKCQFTYLGPAGRFTLVY